MSKQLEDQILANLSRLSDDQQERILDYARTLSETAPKTVPGRDLLAFAGTIQPDELRMMVQAIDESCERVDPSEW